jgi:hypothetical protein
LGGGKDNYKKRGKREKGKTENFYDSRRIFYTIIFLSFNIKDEVGNLANT